MIKILAGFALSATVLLGISGCSSNQPGTGTPTPGINKAGSGAQRNSSFASSTICTDNPFLQKYQCSFAQIEQTARTGDPDAQYALGYLYYYGIGTTQDRQTGLVWIRKAAAQGQTVAQEALRAIAGSNTAPRAAATSPSTAGSAATTPAQPEKPLTDYLPNYGEKRVDTTTTTPPAVNLSTPPATQN